MRPDRTTPEQPTPLPEHLREPDPDSPAGRLFVAARELFAGGGFNGTSTRAIADRAGVNQALLHYYYGSKAHLYRRVLATEFLRLLCHQTEGRLGVLPTEDLLATFPGRMLSWFSAHPETAQLLRREIGAEGGVLQEIIVELGPHGPLGMRKRFTQALRGATGDRALRKIPPDHILASLLALSYGFVLMAPLLKTVLALDIGRESTLKGLQASLETMLRGGLMEAGDA